MQSNTLFEVNSAENKLENLTIVLTTTKCIIVLFVKKISKKFFTFFIRIEKSMNKFKGKVPEEGLQPHVVHEFISRLASMDSNNRFDMVYFLFFDRIFLFKFIKF